MPRILHLIKKPSTSLTTLGLCPFIKPHTKWRFFSESVLFRISACSMQCWHNDAHKWKPKLHKTICLWLNITVKLKTPWKCVILFVPPQKKKNYLLSWSWDWDPPLQTEFIEFRWRIRSNWPSLGQVCTSHVLRWPSLRGFETALKIPQLPPEAPGVRAAGFRTRFKSPDISLRGSQLTSWKYRHSSAPGEAHLLIYVSGIYCMSSLPSITPIVLSFRQTADRSAALILCFGEIGDNFFFFYSYY